MYTGTQKKAIVIKNTGSSMFEAAYFILKDDLSDIKESEMVKEANKILRQSGDKNAYTREAMRKK